MKAANDVQFRNPEKERFTSLLHDFIGRQLKTIGIAFLTSKRAELAAQDAIIRIIDVAVDDIAGPISLLAQPASPRQIRNGADHIQIFALEKPQRVRFGNAFTRLYFDDEQEANARDPVLGAVPAERRATLIARREEVPGGLQYRFDIHMQGPRETVFFDL